MTAVILLRQREAHYRFQRVLRTIVSAKWQRSRPKVILHVRGNYKGRLLDHDLAFIVLVTDQFQLVVGWKEIASHLPIRGILNAMCGDAATLPQL